jgi:lysophospholipase L1-like esterase
MRKGILFVATGDSITWQKISGTPAPLKGSEFYATQIRDYLRTKYDAVRLINKGYGGATSSKMVTNLPWVTNLEPDLVTIGLGMNDCTQISTATYKANLNIIIDRWKQQVPNAKIILCSPSRTTDPARTPTIQSFRDAMAEVATARNLPLCKFENAWTSGEDATCITTDNVHPTPTGQSKLYTILQPVVASTLGLS